MMLSRRERRIAIFAAVVIGALVLDAVLVSPLLGRWREAQARIVRATGEQQSARQLFENDLRARQRWSEMAGTTLTSSASEAEGQVLNRAREWAQESGLVLTSLTPERSEPEHGFERITVRATGNGGIEEVARFLFAVETADIPVRAGDISVTSRREGTDELQMQVVLSTIYLPPDERDGGARELSR